MSTSNKDYYKIAGSSASLDRNTGRKLTKQQRKAIKQQRRNRQHRRDDSMYQTEDE